MKALLIGCNGQLGTDLNQVLSAGAIEVTGLTHAQIEVSSSEQVEAVLEACRPDVVVNTSAFHKVEECEKQPERSFQVNAVGAWNLARACNRHCAVLVHFSTDYVFDGRKSTAYSESDLPCPLNVYGASKLAGEQMIAAATDRYFVLRTSGLYGVAGSSGKGGNFVELMLRKAREGNAVRVVDDQVLTPTFTADLAAMVGQLIATSAYGLYHASCEGECSWYRFARSIHELEHIAADLVPVTTDQFPSPVRRPAYSVLSKKRLGALGLTMPGWEDSLVRYLVARRSKIAHAQVG